MEHVRADLSAYLDDALAPARRSEVQAHLDGCGACRGSLAELRSTARLIGALPPAVPSRRLVPDLAPRLNWLRPLRSFSAVAAGTFLLVFMASATLDTGFRMGGGRAGTTTFSGGGTAPAGAPAPAAPGGQPTDTRTALPRALQSADAQRALQATATPKSAAEVAADAAASPPREQGLPGAAGAQGAVAAPEPLRIGPSPWFWLALTVLSAILAFVTHRRLRAR